MISIVMPCYNRAHDLIHTLEAYDRQAGDDPFELIAVDDASSDDTYGVLASFRPQRYALRVERMESNQGPATARNRGIALADSPLILIVGDDIYPEDNLVQGHLAAHRDHPAREAAILGRIAWPQNMPVNTLMQHIDGVGAQQFSYHYLEDGQEYDFRHFYTANISIKLEFLQSLDRWFDTDFRHAAFEDAELAYRLSLRGLRIIYASNLIGYHFHYHNIWTFSERQRKSGAMARILTAKHPAVRFTPAFRAQYTRLLKLLRHLRVILNPLPAEFIARTEEAACRLVSYYEWNSNKLLDRLYLGVLDYFYYDGVIRGFFGESRLGWGMRSAHARYYLVPALDSFSQQVEGQNIIPPGLKNLIPIYSNSRGEGLHKP